MSYPIEPRREVAAPAHHRPPAVEYRDGIPYHYTVGQPPALQHITVQLPEARGLSPELQRLIIITFLILAVVVVCTGALIAIVVMMGGTLMGIIGAVSAAAVPVGMTAVGVLLAIGWAASKVKGLTKRDEDARG